MNYCNLIYSNQSLGGTKKIIFMNYYNLIQSNQSLG